MKTFPHVLFLNGPTQSGKSTLASQLQGIDSGLQQIDFALPLYDALTDLCYNIDDEYPMLHTQEVKAALIPNISKQVTHRQALVSLGHWVRMAFGADFLARRALDEMTSARVANPEVDFIIPNCRTLDDCSFIAGRARPSRCFVLHIIRPGYDWEGDLGQYFTAPAGVPSQTLVNDSTIDVLVTRALEALGVDVPADEEETI